MIKNKKANINVLRPVKQYFDWGNVKWLDEPEDLQSGKLLVGHVTFLPRKRQGKHLHTADEQILYTISGKGEHWVNDKYYPLVPGTVHYIPPYTEHDIRNLGETPLEMIIIYNSRSLNFDKFLPSVDFLKEYSAEYIRENIDISRVQKIQDELSKALGLCIVIQDEKGNLLTKPSNMPKFCKLRLKSNKECYLKSNNNFIETKESTVKACCYDLVKINAPIYFENKFIGSIFCGPVILNEHSEDTIKKIGEDKDYSNINEVVQSYLDIRQITKGRLYAIIDSLKTINNFIVEIGMKGLIHEELHNKTLEILKQTQIKNELEKALVESKMKVIQAQISPHFLFNTLSVIGQLAYMKGANEAAETTFALSNLLRTSLSKSQELILVKEEIKYLEDYIFIQNKRFENKIRTVLKIDRDVKDKSIPFMTLQPLIENAIVHGFKELGKQGEIKIVGNIKGEKLYFNIKDNGKGISKEVIKNIFIEGGESKKGTGLGLPNLNNRLKYYYGNNYKFKINNLKSGTEVELELPIITKEVF